MAGTTGIVRTFRLVLVATNRIVGKSPGSNLNLVWMVKSITVRTVANRSKSEMMHARSQVPKRATPARRRRIIGQVFSGRGWGKSRCRPRRDVRYMGLNMGQKRVNIGGIGGRGWRQTREGSDNGSSHNTGWAFVTRGSNLERRLGSLIAHDAPVVVTSALERRKLLQRTIDIRNVDKKNDAHDCNLHSKDGSREHSNSRNSCSVNSMDRGEGVDGLDGLASLATQDLPSLGLSQSSDGVEMLLAASDYDSQNRHMLQGEARGTFIN